MNLEYVNKNDLETSLLTDKVIQKSLAKPIYLKITIEL